MLSGPVLALAAAEVFLLVAVIVWWRRAMGWSRRGDAITVQDYPLKDSAFTAFLTILVAALPVIEIVFYDPKFFSSLLRFFGV